eukprot:scaffold8063_cov47-Attheya_sp.AAC.2
MVPVPVEENPTTSKGEPLDLRTDKNLANAVSSLRQGRDAELAELRSSKVKDSLIKQLGLMEDGTIQSSTNNVDEKKEQSWKKDLEKATATNTGTAEGQENSTPTFAQLRAKAGTSDAGVSADKLRADKLREKRMGEFTKTPEGKESSEKATATNTGNTAEGEQENTPTFAQLRAKAGKSDAGGSARKLREKRMGEFTKTPEGKETFAQLRANAGKNNVNSSSSSTQQANMEKEQKIKSEIAESTGGFAELRDKANQIATSGNSVTQSAEKRKEEKNKNLRDELKSQRAGSGSFTRHRQELDDASKEKSGMVGGLDDFYKEQLRSSAHDRGKKVEAAKILHQYTGLVNTAPVAVQPLVNATKKVQVMVDFKNKDYRAFVFVVHAAHGMMLLECTRKQEKGTHFQLPGGHVDEHEFVAAAKQYEDPLNQLLTAAQMGAARELFEETGMNVQSNLDRLQPASLRPDVEFDPETGSPTLGCELRQRLYFFLEVTDADFTVKEENIDDVDTGLVSPIGTEGKNLVLKISEEHSGFTFVKEPKESAKRLTVHSGGAGAEALIMAMKLNMEDNETDNEKNGDIKEKGEDKTITESGPDTQSSVTDEDEKIMETVTVEENKAILDDIPEVAETAFENEGTTEENKAILDDIPEVTETAFVDAGTTESVPIVKSPISAINANKKTTPVTQNMKQSEIEVADSTSAGCIGRCIIS